MKRKAALGFGWVLMVLVFATGEAMAAGSFVPRIRFLNQCIPLWAAFSAFVFDRSEIKAAMQTVIDLG